MRKTAALVALCAFLSAPLRAFPFSPPTTEIAHVTLAQAPEEPELGPSGFGFDAKGLVDELLTAVMVAVVGVLIGRVQMRRDRRELILTLGDIAYGAVHELARRTQNKIDDKAAVGIKYVLDLLRAQGQQPLTAAEETLVRTLFDAKHGNEATLQKLAAPSSPIGGQGEARPQTPPA